MSDQHADIEVNPTLRQRKSGKRQKPPRFTSFELIANAFSVDGTKYLGPVIASKDALFLVIETSVTAAFVASHLMGPLLAGGIAKELTSKKTQPGEFNIADLPEPIREGIRRITGKRRGRVVVLTHELVAKLNYPWWGALRVVADDELLVVKPVFTRQRHVMRVLRHFGWSI